MLLLSLACAVTSQSPRLYLYPPFLQSVMHVFGCVMKSVKFMPFAVADIPFLAQQALCTHQELLLLLEVTLCMAVSLA